MCCMGCIVSLIFEFVLHGSFCSYLVVCCKFVFHFVDLWLCCMGFIVLLIYGCVLHDIIVQYTMMQ